MVRLDSRDPDFAASFARLLTAKREIAEDVDEAVRGIIGDVVARGDDALVAFTRRFDRLGDDFHAGRLRIGRDEIEAAYAACPPEAIAALTLAAERIETFHRAQKPTDHKATDALGVTAGWRWTALESVGLYVPGGTASYPSSVLMNAMPARVAGVPRIVMVVPTPDNILNPLVLAAARLAGVDEIYRIGGAQAVAALAYGTATIAPVAKIVGPGNAYVAAAKRRVFGQVGIDMIAGPSEVLILADGEANPDWIAADLLAQAEHDTAAQAVLITDSGELADAVESAVERALVTLPRAEIARASWRDYGAIIRVRDFDEAIPLTDRIAPEHLEIETKDAEALSLRVRNAGAIFLGSHTPEAIGDYVGGPNHVLPTARSARFSSGLGVLDFMKRTTVLACTPESLRALGPAAITLGRSEGLDGHARSVAIRLNL
jgi:histidinol dehydrogenase